MGGSWREDGGGNEMKKKLSGSKSQDHDFQLCESLPVWLSYLSSMHGYTLALGGAIEICLETSVPPQFID